MQCLRQTKLGACSAGDKTGCNARDETGRYAGDQTEYHTGKHTRDYTEHLAIQVPLNTWEQHLDISLQYPVLKFSSYNNPIVEFVL